MDASIIGILIGLIAVLIGMCLIPLLKNKGILNKESIDATLQVLEITNLILKNANIDSKKKDDISTMVDITNIAVRYVEDAYRSEKGEFKKEVALNAVLESLKKLGLEINNDTIKIVDLAIESAVRVMKNK